MGSEFITNSLTKEIHIYIKPEYTVLNLGCGIGWHTRELPGKNFLHVDVWQPYLEQIKDTLSVIKLNLTDLSMFLDKSWDTVMCIDVIEHLEKDQALKAITEMERIARKNVILYTPIGFQEQHDGQGWGSGNLEFQSHKCGFTEDEMIKKGYSSARSREHPPGHLCVKVIS